MMVWDLTLSKRKKSSSGSSGLGLKSMRNRAKLIGADLSIQSEPEKGTLITYMFH